MVPFGVLAAAPQTRRRTLLVVLSWAMLLPACTLLVDRDSLSSQSTRARVMKAPAVPLASPVTACRTTTTSSVDEIAFYKGAAPTGPVSPK